MSCDIKQFSCFNSYFYAHIRSFEVLYYIHDLLSERINHT